MAFGTGFKAIMLSHAIDALNRGILRHMENVPLDLPPYRGQPSMNKQTVPRTSKKSNKQAFVACLLLTCLCITKTEFVYQAKVSLCN